MDKHRIKKDDSLFRAALLLVFGAVFILMLYCNFHTSLIADDYAYLYDSTYSFATFSRITNVFQIFPSMQYHRIVVNGRVISHFLVQLFLMMPKWVFNIVNSLVFVLELFLIYRSASSFENHAGKLVNILTALFAFSSIWLLQASFGQVNLWLDGSINYLWAATLAVIYIYSYILIVIKGTSPQSVAYKILFLILSFVVGAYGENTSGAMLIFAAGMILWQHITKRSFRTAGYITLISFVATFCGFIFLVTAPAEFSNKVADSTSLFDFSTLIAKLSMLFIEAKPILILIFGAAILWCVALSLKVNLDVLYVSGLLYISALAALLCLVLGSSLEPRTFFLTTVLLTLVCAMLIISIPGNKKTANALCLLYTLCFVLIMPYYVYTGVKDISKTYAITSGIEQQIISCAENGVRDVCIDVDGLIICETEYSPVYGLLYLAQEPDTWPNIYMANYYGVDTIYY